MISSQSHSTGLFLNLDREHNFVIQAASWARSNSSAEIPHSALSETLHRMSRAWEDRKNGIIGSWNGHWQKPEVSSSLRCRLCLIQSSDSLCLTKYLTSELGLNYYWQSFQAPQVPLTSCSSVEALQGDEYSLWGKCWMPSQASRVGLWSPVRCPGFLKASYIDC